MRQGPPPVWMAHSTTTSSWPGPLDKRVVGGILDDQLAAGGPSAAGCFPDSVGCGASWGQADAWLQGWCLWLFSLEEKGPTADLRQASRAMASTRIEEAAALTCPHGRRRLRVGTPQRWSAHSPTPTTRCSEGPTGFIMRDAVRQLDLIAGTPVGREGTDPTLASEQNSSGAAQQAPVPQTSTEGDGRKSPDRTTPPAAGPPHPSPNGQGRWPHSPAAEKARNGLGGRSNTAAVPAEGSPSTSSRPVRQQGSGALRQPAAHDCPCPPPPFPAPDAAGAAR